MPKTKNTGVDRALILTSLYGALIACVIEIVLVTTLALCLKKEIVAIGHIAYLTPLTQFLGALSGMYVAGKGNRDSIAVTCAMIGTFCLIIQLCAASLFFGGVTMGVVGGFVAISSAWIVVVFLLFRFKRSNNFRRKNRRRI